MSRQKKRSARNGKCSRYSFRENDLENRRICVVNVERGAMNDSRLDCKADSRAILTIDHDVSKRRDARNLDADRRKKTSGNGYSFDRLIDCAGTNRLEFDGNAIFDHAGNGSRNRCGRGF